MRNSFFFVILVPMVRNSLLFLFFIFILVSCQSNKKQDSNRVNGNIYSAKIAFNDSIHDFGIVKGDSLIAEYEFEYTNIGDVPAMILNVNTSCGCTTVSYSKEPLMPNQIGKLTVRYNGSNDNSSFFSKSVRIWFNSKDSYLLRIRGICER